MREVQRLLQHPDSLKTLPALLEENTRRLQVPAQTALPSNMQAYAADHGRVVILHAAEAPAGRTRARTAVQGSCHTGERQGRQLMKWQQHWCPVGNVGNVRCRPTRLSSAPRWPARWMRPERAQRRWTRPRSTSPPCATATGCAGSERHSMHSVSLVLQMRRAVHLWCLPQALGAILTQAAGGPQHSAGQAD